MKFLKLHSEILKNIALSGFRYLYLGDESSKQYPNDTDLSNSLFFRNKNEMYLISSSAAKPREKYWVKQLKFKKK